MAVLVALSVRLAWVPAPGPIQEFRLVVAPVIPARLEGPQYVWGDAEAGA